MVPRPSRKLPVAKPTSGDLSGQPAHPFVRVADNTSAIRKFTAMEAAVLPPERGHGIQAARNMLQLQANGCTIAPAGRSYWKFRVTSF